MDRLLRRRDMFDFKPKYNTYAIQAVSDISKELIAAEEAVTEAESEVERLKKLKLLFEERLDNRDLPGKSVFILSMPGVHSLVFSSKQKAQIYHYNLVKTSSLYRGLRFNIEERDIDRGTI